MSITNIADLIERLEAIKADLNVRALTMDQYAEVGWAARPIDALIDQCRDEADANSWSTTRKRTELELRPLAKCGAR